MNDPLGQLRALLPLAERATEDEWEVMHPDAVSALRKVCGEEFYPADCVVIDRPPKTREEAMDTFLHTVFSGFVTEADANFIAASRNFLTPSTIRELIQRLEER